MTRQRSVFWLFCGIAALLVLGRKKSDAPAIGGTPRRREPTADKLQRKIQEFIDEVRGQELTEEQRKIYSVFAGEQSVADIKVHDMTTLYDTFIVKKGAYQYGAKHILIKHYNERKSGVTAQDILDMCEIIRCSMPLCDIDTKNHFYEMESDGKVYKLIFYWNEIKDEAKLISFYTKTKRSS